MGALVTESKKGVLGMCPKTPLVAGARFELTFGPPGACGGPKNVSPTSPLLVAPPERKSKRPGSLPGLRFMRLVAGVGFEPTIPHRGIMSPTKKIVLA